MHTYWGNELSFGEAKLFASKLQNFNLGRITPENGWGTGCLSPGLFHSSGLLVEMLRSSLGPGFPDETV